MGRVRTQAAWQDMGVRRDERAGGWAKALRGGSANLLCCEASDQPIFLLWPFFRNETLQCLFSNICNYSLNHIYNTPLTAPSWSVANTRASGCQQPHRRAHITQSPPFH